MSEISTFRLLWKMVNEIRRSNQNVTGTIISRYSSILDDRLENSGHSRSVESLALYSTEQLIQELEDRDTTKQSKEAQDE